MTSIGLIESKGLVALFEAADYLLKNSPVEILGIKNLENGYLTLGVSGEKDYVTVAIESAVIAAKKVGEIYASSVIENPTENLLQLIKEIFNKEIDKSVPKDFVTNQVELSESKNEVDLNKSESSLVTKKIRKDKRPLVQKELLVKSEKKVTAEPEKEKSEKIEKPLSQKISSSTIERLRKEALGLTPEKKDIKPAKMQVKDLGLTINNKEIDFDAIDKMNVHKLRHYARGFENFPIKGREISRANRNELIELFKKM